LPKPCPYRILYRQAPAGQKLIKQPGKALYMPKNQAARPPLALSVETSGRKGSVAVGQGPQILAETSFSAPLRHSAELFPVVAELLSRLGRRPRQVQHVYVSVGPGSFTGIRIAVTFAKTFHFANNAKVVAVNTMDLLACNATDYMQNESAGINKIATILDAKRGQFFVALFEQQAGYWKKQMPDCLMTAAEFVSRFANKGPIWLLGEGLLYYRDNFKAGQIHILDEKYWLPRAKNLHRLGYESAEKQNFADPATLTPLYLRKPDVKEK